MGTTSTGGSYGYGQYILCGFTVPAFKLGSIKLTANNRGFATKVNSTANSPSINDILTPQSNHSGIYITDNFWVSAPA